MKFFSTTLLILFLSTSCASIPRQKDTDIDGRKIDLAWGQKVYTSSCARCHDTGKNGAQIIGDSAGWSSRVSRGVDVLVKNAIEGYSGALGYMPPRGGNPSLSHEDVVAATAYIVRSSITR